MVKLVYTVALGEGFTLPNVENIKSLADFICLTDKENRELNGWTTRYFDPIFPADLPRSSREPKICPHKFFPDYNDSLYLDTRVQLKVEPEVLWKKLMPSEETLFAACHHSFRRTIREEFTAVRKSRFDDENILLELENFFKKFEPSVMGKKPIWGGILARRHNDLRCMKVMELWFSFICRYSRRDQLTLPFVLDRLKNEDLNICDIDNLKSPFFEWPIETYRPEGYVKPKKRNLFSRIIKF